MLQNAQSTLGGKEYLWRMKNCSKRQRVTCTSTVVKSFFEYKCRPSFVILIDCSVLTWSTADAVYSYANYFSMPQLATWIGRHTAITVSSGSLRSAGLWLSLSILFQLSSCSKWINQFFLIGMVVLLTSPFHIAHSSTHLPTQTDHCAARGSGSETDNIAESAHTLDSYDCIAKNTSHTSHAFSTHSTVGFYHLSRPAHAHNTVFPKRQSDNM